MSSAYREIFIVDVEENTGKNWLVANFGADIEDGKTYIVTSNHMHADEFYCYSQGAKFDAELVAKLLNLYHNNQIKFKVGNDTEKRCHVCNNLGYTARFCHNCGREANPKQGDC